MIINGVWIYYKTDVEQLSRGMRNTKYIVFGLFCSGWKKTKQNPLDTINCNCGLLAGTHSHILEVIICLLYLSNKLQICYSPAVICIAEIFNVVQQHVLKSKHLPLYRDFNRDGINYDG